jgi:HK97 gp10 family phage protein
MAKATRIRNVKFSTGRIVSKNRRARAQALRETAKDMTAMFNKKLSKPYPPASQPGQAPHRRTGRLQQTTKAVYRDGAIVIRTTQYGIYLDGGTSKMEPRPFIRKNIHEQRRTWERRIRTKLRKLTK